MLIYAAYACDFRAAAGFLRRLVIFAGFLDFGDFFSIGIADRHGTNVVRHPLAGEPSSSQIQSDQQFSKQQNNSIQLLAWKRMSF
jgi:hypothetical protein